MTAVGVLGLGRMGAPIARRLAEAGFEVSSHDPRVAGATLDEVAGSADVLLTVLPGASDVDAAAPGILAALRSGSLWVDLTSNDPRAAELIAGFAAVRGVDFVGAPMGGGPAAAASGGLRFYLGGTAVDRARAVLEPLGTIDHVGDSVGAGYTAKLLANLLWFGQAVAVTEALLLGKSLGIPPATLRRTLADGAGGSVFIDEYLDRLLEGDYLESFGIDRCVEELEILASLARGVDVPFELSSTVARLHREALERFGAIDGELLAAKLLEERAGTTLRTIEGVDSDRA